MRNFRLDSRLYQIFALLGALTLIVGVLAIGVNHHLIRSHKALLGRAMPVTETASRLQARAELAESLTQGVAHAASHEELDRMIAALDGTVSDFLDGYNMLAGFLDRADWPGGAELRGQVAGMDQAARAALDLGERRRAAGQRIAETGAAVSVLLAEQTDLARVRVTAGIADLHAGQPSGRSQAALDRLADQAFFAFERVEELARGAELLRIASAQIAGSDDAARIAAVRGRLAGLIAEARMRVDYLVTDRARIETRAALDAYEAGQAGDGFAGLGAAHVAALRQRDRVIAAFHADVAQMAITAQEMQIIAQQDNLDRIAALAERSNRLFGVLLAAVVAALIGAVATILYARRRLLARMGRVSERLLAVAGGDFGRPMAITGRDQIGRAEKAVNVLRHRARQALHLRSRLAEAVQTRTRELVEEMHAADVARAEAESADRRKTEFLARMSHEIRTPLNGLIGMLELASDSRDPVIRDRLDIALGSARDLLQISNDILAFASADGAETRVSATHFRLADLIAQIRGPLAALADQKGLETLVDPAPDVPPVLLGDQVKIRQVLTNLLSNAVKYTEAGRITLLVHRSDGGGPGAPLLHFTVADTGAGMSADQAGHVFDDFTRAEWARRAGIEGAGLGLAISRRLAEAMGGALTVETAPGVGSRFTLTVPLVAGDPALADRPAPDPVPAHCDAKVLVVEDHPVSSMVARGFLERLGCTVTEAATAAEAVRAAAEGRFDLALVDLDLPDRPGDEVIARLRRFCPATTIAAMTAHLIGSDAVAGLDVDAVLTKPLSPRALADLLAGLPGRANPPMPVSLDADIAALGAGTVQAMLTAFLDDLPAAVAAITGAEGTARSRAAHRLRGAASNFGLADFRALLAGIEADPAALDPTRLQAAADAARDGLIAAARRSGLQPPASGISR